MKKWGLRAPLAVVAAVLALCVSSAVALGGTRDDQPTPIARGPHISGVAQVLAHQPAAAAAAAAPSTCSTPGATNYKTNCHGTGRPVNETWIAPNPAGGYVAGANDYNSYNGQGQNGYYTSSDGKTWTDAGPIDVFPHNVNNGAGDPGLAVDSSGVVYYSSLFFNFNNCSVGGVELLRRNPSTGAWTYFQIAANSKKQFQDKPAIALSGANVLVSWTQFGSCSGVNVPSPIKVAVFPQGASSVAPTTILSVPGSTNSQGSSIQGDGSGGFWIAWEEYPSPSATIGSIKLVHWSGGSFGVVQTISPAGFTDLPSPLPGFSFRDNSFPALAMVAGQPQVTWTSYDTGVGRAYLWTTTHPAAVVSNTGGSQFFPAIAADGSGGTYVSYSQINAGTQSYDQWVSHVTSTGTTTTKVSTASSFPSNDAFFSGQFIGDYSGMTATAGTAHPIWTDIRGPDPNFSGYEMDAFVYSP
jgi:hypothetical protein